MIAPVEVKVEKDETKADNWNLILHVSYASFIPLFGEFATENEAQEQADIYNKDIVRASKSWCSSMVRDAVNTNWLLPALKGKF